MRNNCIEFALISQRPRTSESKDCKQRTELIINVCPIFIDLSIESIVPWPGLMCTAVCSAIEL